MGPKPAIGPLADGFGASRLPKKRRPFTLTLTPPAAAPYSGRLSRRDSQAQKTKARMRRRQNYTWMATSCICSTCGKGRHFAADSRSVAFAVRGCKARVMATAVRRRDHACADAAMDRPNVSSSFCCCWAFRLFIVTAERQMCLSVLKEVCSETQQRGQTRQPNIFQPPAIVAITAGPEWEACSDEIDHGDDACDGVRRKIGTSGCVNV